MSDGVQVDSFYKYLISKGYYFDKELIENFLLSLKVKPFEILTGNSGTGKTRLSQLFAEYLRNNDPHLVGTTKKANSDFHFVKATTKLRSWGKGKDGITDERPGWTLSVPDFRSVLPLDEIEGTYEIEIGGYKTTGEINFVPQVYYQPDCEDFKNYFKELYDIEQEQIKKDAKNDVKHVDQKVDLGICWDAINDVIIDEYQQSDVIIFEKGISNTFLKGHRIGIATAIRDYIPIKTKVSCELTAGGFFAKGNFDLKFKMSNYMTDEIKDYLNNLPGNITKVEIKIFGFKPDISNFSCTYDTFNDYNQKDSGVEGNYTIVPVGANWTDNTNIIGYHNVITNDYQSTPTYKLIKRAQNDFNNPYFLILDEMNLSHVERYFADFLSAIESGEEIPLYGNNETLKLPDNLFIIGTVNVDETTYMFSPKVLDRSNTIEFDTLSAWEYMSSNLGEGDFEGDIEYLQSPLMDSDICKLNIEDLKDILSEITYDNENLWDTLAMELTGFQETLKGSGFDFGFRVINEILRFMVVAWKYENSPNEWNNWERYFDAQIKQKILPKLHGSQKAIGNVLTDLFNICLENRNNNENPKNFIVTEGNVRYYTSALKLQNMVKVLSDQRYVSFIN